MIKREYIHYYPGYRKGNITLIERMEKGHKWKYECDCGYVGITQVSENPGCCPECSRKKFAEGRTKHGEAPDDNKNATRLYGIWLGMKQRCNNSKNPGYENYGGRGIKVCDEWQKDYLMFKIWALESGYSDNLSIDRINVDGNYEPINCRWVDQITQCNNKRNNRKYEYNGEMLTIRDIANMTGYNYGTIKRRLNKAGWSVEETIKRVPRKGNNQKLRRAE